MLNYQRVPNKTKSGRATVFFGIAPGLAWHVTSDPDPCHQVGGLCGGNEKTYRWRVISNSYIMVITNIVGNIVTSYSIENEY